MKYLTSLVLAVTLLLLPGLVMVPAVGAVDVLDPVCQNASEPKPPVCSDSGQTANPLFGPKGILTFTVNILSVVAGVIAVFVILIAGVKMITSNGDPQSVQSSRQAVLYAVISLLVVASAQVIVRFILNKF